MKNWCCLIAALLTIVGAARGVRADATDDYIKAEMTRQQIPGLALAVLRDGKPIKVMAYGLANVEQKTPVTLDTAFDVGSMGKPFTAAAVLMLVETGKIRLAEPISRFFSGTPATWRGITVWHLLTHTSGIRDYTTEIPTTAVLEFTPDLVYQRAIGAPLNFPPGTQFRYSHTNYVLLGLVTESATGRPFHELVADRIFKPLDMTHTQTVRPDKPAPNMATGYRMTEGERVPTERERYAFGDAFCSSTIDDLVKWAAALDTGAILSEPARTAMWTPAPLLTPTAKSGAAPAAPKEKPKTASYGLGWYTESLNGHRVIGHGGASGGFSGSLSRFPDDHLTVIVLTNLRDVNAFPLVRGVASRYSAALK